MIRKQVQLTDAQARRLRAEAREQHVSLAEVIRPYAEKRVAERASDRAALYDHAAHVVGQFRDHDDAHDVSIAHDRYLDEAFDWRR